MRWVRRLLVFLLFLAVALFVAGFFLVRRPFPQIDGEIPVAGLEQAVEVIRDIDGVPHIYAATSHDLFFAQGYVHAQDRFWQMDFWRHIGAGRVAEMFGESQVESDMFLRALDFTGLAEQELSMISPEARAVLEAYAAGVNAYVGERSPSQLGLEYALLPLQAAGYEIEPWTALNTLTWGKVMSWDLSSNIRTEIERAVLSVGLPMNRVEQLYPPYPENHPVVVPSDQVASASAEPPTSFPQEAVAALARAGRRAGSVWEVTGGGFSGIGSNNWVVGGSRTATGLPILANDPHLAIQMPSIWYQNGLHCTVTTEVCPFQIVGFSFAGSPGVVIGHNEHIAWGVTTEAVDTQDLFVEKVNPDDPGQYEFEGGWVDFEIRPEIIRVAGGEDVDYEVMVSRHGPVISDLFFDDASFTGSAVELPSDYVVSMAWQTLEPSTLVDAILGIDIATNYEEFREAAALWDIAAQNLVYADTSGNIAYQATGEVPVRASGDGAWPVPGWTGDHEWVGVVPVDDLPHLFNPPRDFVASANQPIIPPSAEPFFTVDADLGHRAARIEAMIESVPSGYDGGIAAQMQMDTSDGGAPNLVPHLLALPADDEVVAAMQEVLRPWSAGSDPFQSGAESPGAAAYQAVWTHLLRLTFHDELPEDHWPEGGSRWFQVIASLLESPDDLWWDDVGTGTVEDRDLILTAAMTAAHAELVETLGSESGEWRWADLHVASFENLTFGQSGIAPIEWLFNRTAPRRVGGSADLVNAVGFNPPDGYLVDWIPSMRMVIDLADLSASTAINTTGQSGHPFHTHYEDMLEDWTDGNHRSLRWTRDQVEAEAEGRLVLVPDS